MGDYEGECSMRLPYCTWYMYRKVRSLCCFYCNFPRALTIKSFREEMMASMKKEVEKKKQELDQAEEAHKTRLQQELK